MNFLAHIYLSGNDEELKIGNFVADSVKGKKYMLFPPKIQQGIILHRAIDTYTDTHPVVRKSVHRLFPIYSYYSSVIVDILYDHYLAANWLDYSTIPLDHYVQEFYDLLTKNYKILPLKVQQFLPFMIRDNWILNYATIEGIEKILSQMDQRTGNKSKMELAVHELKRFYLEFGEEFKLFFFDLENYTQDRLKKF